MKNRFLLFLTFITFSACYQHKITENKIENIRATLSFLDMMNAITIEDIEKLKRRIMYYQEKNPYKEQLKIEITNFCESVQKNIIFIYNYRKQLNKNEFQRNTLITHKKSNEITNMLIAYLGDLQKKYNHLRTDTLFKGFFKKENKQDFFYEYYFENTSMVESLISLEEIVFVLLQYQQECMYTISQKYLEKGNLTRIEILNKKEKYQIGDTILLGLEGAFPKIKTFIKAYTETSQFDKFLKNTWYYVIPKNIRIGKNELYTKIQCMRENQKDTIFSRTFLFQVSNR
ncbi:MAG: hypothetical protein EAZ85_07215 [Bacteroidetes bacterium]|nr:MAG: hypothetical protein EAZ85_07215 [Bacteroidota bacterium]